MARLDAEKARLKELFAEANRIGNEVLTQQKDLTATAFNTAVPVISGAIKVVAGAFSGDAGKAVDGAKDLLQYLKDNANAGAKVWVLLKTAKALAELKRLAMLAVIYHDQQVKAPTCGPLPGGGVGTDEDDGQTTTNGGIEDGGGRPPEEVPFPVEPDEIALDLELAALAVLHQRSSRDLSSEELARVTRAADAAVRLSHRLRTRARLED